MDKKIKLIAIILGALCLAALFTAFSYVNKYKAVVRDNQQLEKDKQDLRQENNVLAQKSASSQQEASRLKERYDDLKSENEHLTSERDDLKKRYDDISEEKNKLIDKLQDALAKGTAEEASGAQMPEVIGDQYWANVLKEKQNLELQLADLRDKLRNSELMMSELSGNKSDFELELQKVGKEKDEIQRQLEYNEKMADSLSLQLVREKDDKRKLEKQANLLKEENYALRNRLKEVTGTKVSLEKKLKAVEDKRLELYNRLNQADQLMQEKLSEVMDVKQDLKDIRKGATPISGSAVELSPIVVHSSQEEVTFKEPEAAVKKSEYQQLNPASLPLEPPISSQEIMVDASHPLALTAKIRSVDSDNNFVIFDAGANQGIRKGQVLNVFRNSKMIAALEVIETKANVSAADIKEKISEPRSGDTVR